MTEIFEIVQQMLNVSLLFRWSSARKIDVHMACRDGDSSSARRAILYSTPPGEIEPPRITKKTAQTYHVWKVFRRFLIIQRSDFVRVAKINYFKARRIRQ